MAQTDIQIWYSVALLFLSKFVTSTTQTFYKKDIINDKNIGLGAKFADMLGTETEESEVREHLKKALKQLEQQNLLQRSSAGEMHLTPTGISAMNAERSRAMEKIAQNFPESGAREQPSTSAGNKAN